MKQLLLLCSFIMLSQMTNAQTIKGKVIDDNDEPVIGATVQIVNQNIGITTDIDGNYSIEVNEDILQNGEIQFSYIGFQTITEKINGRTLINITLSEGVELEAVTVVSIGISRKEKQLGYAATQVSTDEIDNSNELNIANALNSKVAGVQVIASSGSPGASTSVRIRGNKSINGDNNPLYVVDGVPIDNSYRGSNFTDQANRIADINPDDIASMTVLKGGAATALYGVRAANGAIIITTKSGKNGKTQVNFSSMVMFDQVNKLPEKQSLFSQGENNAFREGSRFSWGARMDTMSYDGSDWRFHRKGRLVSINDATATGEAAEIYNNPIDFFRTGMTFDNHLSLQGGNDLMGVYLSIGDSRQQGIIPNTDFARTSIKLTGKTKVWDKLNVTTSLNYVNSNAERGQRGSNLSGVMLGLMRSPSSYDLTNDVENPVENSEAYQFADGTQRTYHAAYDNPYWSVNKNRNFNNLDRLIAFTELQVELAEGLTLLERLSVDYYSDSRRSYWDGFSNEYKDLGGRIFNLEITQRNINSDLILSYQKRLGDDFDFTITTGHNYTDYKTTSLETDGFGFIIPEFYDITNTSIINAFADDYIEQERGIGVYADLNIGYKNFIYLTVNGRNDWLSNLPKGNNSFFYSSYSLGFVFSELLVNNDILDYGKLRLSYAQTGNGAPSPYLTDNFFVASGTSVQGLISYFPSSTIGNANLRPENTTSYEGGFDMRFFRNRVGVDFTAYFTSTKDQIINIPISTSSGYVAAVTNAGEITNQGIEVLLNLDVIRPENNGGLSWETSLNFTRNVNNVVSITDELDNIPLPSFGVASTQSRVIVGQPYGVIFGSRWLRDDNGNVLIDNNGFPIRDGENGVVGDPNPDFLAGWRNTFSWKGFNLTFLWDVNYGAEMFNGTVGVMKFHGTHVSTENRDEPFVFDGVLQNSGEANTIEITQRELFTRYGLTYISEENIERADWLRLRDLSLTYQFSYDIAQRIRAERLSLSIITRNLLLFTPYSGIDPETTLSGAANSFGRDYFNSPGTRSYGVKLKVTF